MKRMILLAASLISLRVMAAEPVEVESSITDVTVYRHDAQVTRQARVTLVKGNTVLAFRGLPENIDPQSIQAGGTGDFILLSMLQQKNYLMSGTKTKTVQALQDTLQRLEDQQAVLAGRISVFKSEEDLLNANRSLGGGERTITVAELKQAADFYRVRLTEIKTQEIQLTARNMELTRRIEKVKNQLKTMDAEMNRPTSEILLNVSCTAGTSAALWISYIVHDAEWTPVYDIRARDVHNPVTLIYNARVTQHTGEDWKQVSLKLSTANPRQPGNRPELQPWYIDFIQPFSVGREPAVMRYNAPEMAGEKDKLLKVAPTAAIAPPLAEAEEAQTSVEFTIRVPYDIPSDNKPYVIHIQENTLPAVYEYYCAPKLDPDAFLVARIVGWEDLNLLPGEMNLFFEGTYVGQSELNTQNTSDTLDLSLGRDKSIIVNRTKVQDLTTRKVIGSNIRISRTWEITVRNARKEVVDLRLEDQLPVSTNKDILVEARDLSGGTYLSETGKVTWRMHLEPASEKKLRLSFDVRYPKDKQVIIE